MTIAAKESLREENACWSWLRLSSEMASQSIFSRRVWGEFHISLLTVPVRNPKGKDRGHPVRLGLEGVRVEGGGVVFDIEMMEHFQVVVHAGTAEAHGAPFFQGAVDFDGLPPENRFGSKRIVIMMQAVGNRGT